MTTNCGGVSMWVYCVIVAMMWQSCTAQTRLCGRQLADALDFVCYHRGFNMGRRDGRSIGSVYKNNGRGNNMANSHSSSSGSWNDDDDNINDNNNENYRKFNYFQGDNAAQAQTTTRSKKAKSYYKQKRYELVNFLRSIDITRPYNFSKDYEIDQPQTDAFSKVDNSQYAGLLLGPGNMAYGERRRRRQTSNVVEECCLRSCTRTTLESYCAPPDKPEEVMPAHEIQRLFSMTSPHPSTTQRPRHRTPTRPPAQINRGRAHHGINWFFVPTQNSATRSPLLLDRHQS